MTFEEFDAYSADLMAQVLKMRDTKGREYAGEKDRFDNFNRLAARLEVPRLKVWQVYFTKHLDAIESFIRVGEVQSTETIQGRIVDAITYLLLMGGMAKEDAEHRHPTKENVTTTRNWPVVERLVHPEDAALNKLPKTWIKPA